MGALYSSREELLGAPHGHLEMAVFCGEMRMFPTVANNLTYKVASAHRWIALSAGIQMVVR